MAEIDAKSSDETSKGSKVGTTRRRSRALLGIASAFCYLAAFFVHGIFILLVPGLLQRSQRGLSLPRRLGWCAAWGVVFALCYYSWAFQYGLLPMAALSLVRGLPWALFALPVWAQERFSRSTWWQEAVATAFGFSVPTAVLLMGITGADWETPVGAFAEFPVLLIFLPWLGLMGGGFLIGLLSALMISGEKRARAVGLSLTILYSLAAVFTYKSTPERETPEGIALVQTGWSQDTKWGEENSERAKERLLELTEMAVSRGAKLVVWPETAWPIRGMRKRFKDTRKIGGAARRLKVEILASSIEEVNKGWFNSVSQVLPTGKFESEYRKRRLAPFAEYIPLPEEQQYTLREMPAFHRISPYLPGEEGTLFESALGRYAVLICYESMTSALPRQMAGRADFLVIVTNDAPFVAEYPKEAHFRSAILRAAANRTPVVQAANTGVTGFISSKGRVLKRTPTGYSGPTVEQREPHGVPDP